MNYPIWRPIWRYSLSKCAHGLGLCVTVVRLPELCLLLQVVGGMLRAAAQLCVLCAGLGHCTHNEAPPALLPCANSIQPKTEKQVESPRWFAPIPHASFLKGADKSRPDGSSSTQQGDQGETIQTGVSHPMAAHRASFTTVLPFPECHVHGHVV